MLFDKFAGFVEQHHSELLPVMQQAALFDFPYRAHEAVGPGMFNQEDLDGFFLPFPVVAIEDLASCIMLIDSVSKQIGLKGNSRDFIEIQTILPKDPSAYRVQLKKLRRLRQKAKEEGLHQITFGTLYEMGFSPTSEKNYQVLGLVNRLVIVNGRGEIIMDFTADQIGQETIQGTLKNVISSVEEIMLLNRDPKLFILEQTPVEERQAKKGRLLRSHDRSRFVILKPNAIRKVMGLKKPADKSGEGGGPRPHERRRHWRTLRSEKFTHKRGERILIEAHWVGPSEAVNNKTRYRVRLDL